MVHMLRWTVEMELTGDGSVAPDKPPSRTELRGAVYQILLGGSGHHGWTPWRTNGLRHDGNNHRVRLDLLWLPDHYRPECEPTPSAVPHRVGSWMVRIVDVQRHPELDRSTAAAATGCCEFTVTTRQPVLLTRELPSRIDTNTARTVEILYPDEAAIIRSLARDWNSAAELRPGLGADPASYDTPSVHPRDAALMGELTAVSMHRDLRSVRVQVNYDRASGWRTYRRCLTGAWVMRLMVSDDPEMARCFSRLMNWANFAGLGAGASLGLGRVRVTPGNKLTHSGKHGAKSRA